MSDDQNQSPEGRRAQAYLETIDRIEPEIAMIDPAAFYASAAISLKRLADAAEALTKAVKNRNKLMALDIRNTEVADHDKHDDWLTGRGLDDLIEDGVRRDAARQRVKPRDTEITPEK